MLKVATVAIGADITSTESASSQLILGSGLDLAAKFTDELGVHRSYSANPLTIRMDVFHNPSVANS